jgi:hypothetical protein
VLINTGFFVVSIYVVYLSFVLQEKAVHTLLTLWQYKKHQGKSKVTTAVKDSRPVLFIIEGELIFSAPGYYLFYANEREQPPKIVKK